MAFMKTVLSIDEGLYRKAEALSAKLNVSRSQLFAQALEYLLDKSETLEIIRKLNAVYGLNDIEQSPLVKRGKRKMKTIVGKV